ncbi:MAG: hypothetical protein K2G56_03760, partial [Eubacterium sp.]|nr:hypothetical protein [Eubacterium sp.]
MNNTVVKNNEIIFSRHGEVVQLTACYKNSIRFEAFPEGRIYEENFTLMPQSETAEITEDEYSVSMHVGSLTARLERSGKIIFYHNEKVILEEKPELAFNGGYRHYACKDNGAWSTRVTFKANDNEHFYGLGHEPIGKFDLKGCSLDIRNVNTKCTIP